MFKQSDLYMDTQSQRKKEALLFPLQRSVFPSLIKDMLKGMQSHVSDLDTVTGKPRGDLTASPSEIDVPLADQRQPKQ